jgi:hypothetical protein
MEFNKKVRCNRSIFGFITKCSKSVINPDPYNAIDCAISSIFVYQDCYPEKQSRSIIDISRRRFRENIDKNSRSIKYSERDTIPLSVIIMECVNCKNIYKNTNIEKCTNCGGTVFKHKSSIQIELN